MRNNIFIILFIGLLLPFISNSQSNLLFFDDFEETISNDATFTKWTSENIEGWHYWHIVPGQHMRFENNDITNNDWLITNPILYPNADSVLISFNYNYHAYKKMPKLLYTNRYNGNSAESNWKEIDYNLGINEDEWYSSGDLIIENPGDTIYFAFHYQAEPDKAIYFLLDDFKVNKYVSVVYEKVGESEHFEFYTSNINNSEYWKALEGEMEAKYLNYTSIWQRPGFNPIFPTTYKIKVKYCLRENIAQFNQNTPLWDCGSIDKSNGEIFISPLISTGQINYYGDLTSLAINELSQLALSGWLNTKIEDYYLEGFGLYEMGYRPNRENLIQKLSDIGTNEPGVEEVTDISQLNFSGNKDLMASLFESKALLNCYFYNFYYNDMRLWWQLIKHYYIKETDRVQQIYSTEHFDYYAAEKEIPYIEAMSINMEKQFELQEGRFKFKMYHRVNICIYDNDVGLEINDRTDFQGLACGADKINTSHLDIDDYGLLNHEFMHMWVNILSNHNPGPGQFLNEGLAESTDAFMTDEEMPWHNYKIQGMFYHYQRKYNREPSWLEIVDNAEVGKEDGMWVDAYALGEMYWRYMNDNYPVDFWIKVKLFLQGGRDWTVFGGKTTEEEGAEFMQFMKELAFVGPPLETTALPFYEDFENSFNGWSLLRYGVDDLWKNEEDAGINGSYCAYIVDPYWLEEKDVDSWLVTPPLNCEGVESINVNFMYKQHGQGIKPEVYYAGNFTGAVDPVDWVLVENISWDAIEGEWSKMELIIQNVPSKLNIAIRFLSEDGNNASYLIDDFDIEIKSNLNFISLSPINEFKIYPNPINEESIISFNNTVSGKVNLTLFDIHGRKVCTILDKELSQGEHIINIWKFTPDEGVYFCRLSTSSRTSTIKYIVDK